MINIAFEIYKMYTNKVKKDINRKVHICMAGT